MPKNPNLNIPRYKVAGGELNEFEFSQNQQAFVEQQQHDADNLIPGTPPEMKSEPEDRRGGTAVATAVTKVSTKTRNKLPPKTRRQAGTKKATSKGSVSQKGREKSAKKPAKPTKPAKRSAASKRRPATKAAKRSTRKAAKKTGTKKK